MRHSRASRRQLFHVMRHSRAGAGAGVNRKTLKSQLATLGVAGVVAYGILNTIYYTAAFYLIWRYAARVPRGAHRQKWIEWLMIRMRGL